MIGQQTNSRKLFNYFFILVSVAIFVMAAIQCAVIPFCHDETITFYYYIQSGDFLPFHAHVDTNNHVLNSFLSWICFKLFGDSPFSLRLPNLLALPVLICATYRVSGRLTKVSSKLALMAGFMLSFHWLSFYTVCRGYGLSMSFFILGISYLMDYFTSKDLSKLILFYLFIQIAISANLILVIITIPLTLAVILFQLLNKELLKPKSLLALLVHLALVLFWLEFSFFLQANFLEPSQSMFASASLGYWKITFVSLINILSGNKNHLLTLFVLLGFIITVIASVSINFKEVKTNIRSIFSPSLFYTLLLLGVIAMFYLMHIFLQVSYPEDRMGLFFYVFFVLSAAFTLDRFSGRPAKIISGLIVAGALIHFGLYINFHKHLDLDYNTIPERFYTRLLEEQKESPDRITLVGQDGTELIYDYLNYLHGGVLNLNDGSTNAIQMDCDYVIVRRARVPFFKPYYDEIDVENDWGQTLMKRKEKIKRNLIISIDTLKPIKGDEEYYNLYEVRDTSFKSNNPLLVEINIGSVKAEMPIQSWLVMEIDSSEGHSVCFRKIPLNWLKYDWNTAKNIKLDMLGLQLPPKIHRLVCYIWNLEKKEIGVRINSVMIYQLEGNGINVVAPAHITNSTL
ncbi:MAG TPA: hypothetical protein VK808_10205 [Bacteroidia bacterium]|nr:hypothetical protein [Bacteroidia bacterium]